MYTQTRLNKFCDFVEYQDEPGGVDDSRSKDYLLGDKDDDESLVIPPLVLMRVDSNS